MNYSNNIFTKFIENPQLIPWIINSQHSMAFHDKFPKADMHILVIPKGHYRDMADFLLNSSPEEQLDFNNTIKEIIIKFQLEEKGFNIKVNNRESHGQEIFHFHLHILS
jgi:diadenosine tetraphosphate (Ap4A) HIT family hydrolase